MSAAPSLAELAAPRPAPPPRVLVLGEPGVGKTTLARDLGAVILPLESGHQYLAPPAPVLAPASGVLPDFDSVLYCLRRLRAEAHPWRVVCLDTLDALERLVWAKTISEHNATETKKVANIEGFGYGKGFVAALSHWQVLLTELDALRLERGVLPLLLAHPRQRETRDQDLCDYTTWDLDLNPRAAALVRGWADAVWFAGFQRHYETRGVAKETKENVPIKTLLARELRCAPAPGAATKSRVPAPPVLQLDPGAAPVRAVLAPWLAPAAPQ